MMKKIDSLWARVFGGIIAVVLTFFLFVINAPPFSLIEVSESSTGDLSVAEASATEAAATEAATTEPSAEKDPVADESTAGTEAEEKPSSGESITQLGKLIVIVQKPFDIKDSVTENNDITLLNRSTEAVKVSLFVEGMDTCKTSDSQNCVAFFVEKALVPEITVDLVKPSVVTVSFQSMKLESTLQPAEGNIILISKDGQVKIPFVVASKWKQDWTAILVLVIQILTALIVAYILYLILYSKIIPMFYFERFLPMQMEVTEENKALLGIFTNRLALMQEQGIGKNLINPQVPPKTIELPANLGKQGDFLRALIELVSWIFPRRGLTIRMSLVETKTNGKGISASLTQNRSGKVLIERTFTTKTYGIDPETMDYQDLLMIPIILWLSNWWEKQYPSEAQAGTHWEVKSYCMLANLLWVMNPSLGRELYMNALFLEPSNREAHAGLGRIWLEDSQKDDLSDYEKQNHQELAAAYLSRVAAEMVGEEDTLWFAANYNLAVNLLNVGEPEKARKYSKQISSEIESILSKNLNSAETPYIQWLKKFRVMALVFRHSVSLEAKETCPPNQIRLNNKINIAIRAVRSAVSGISEKASLNDNTFDPQKILLVGLDYRTQYNAACYFSRCYKIAKTNDWKDNGQYAEAALDYLRMALGHGGGLIRYARKDQALEPIRSDKVYSERFDKIAKEKGEEETKKSVEDELKIVFDKPIILKTRKPYFSKG